MLAALLCPGALAGQGLLVGVSEDGMKWSPERAALGARERQAAGSAPAVDQPSQLANAIGLGYCQPYVGAFFNFLLADERTLTGWQSPALGELGTEAVLLPLPRRRVRGRRWQGRLHAVPS